MTVDFSEAAQKFAAWRARSRKKGKASARKPRAVVAFDENGRVSAEYARLRLSYDPETGIMRWREWPDISGWDQKHAGRIAGRKNMIGQRKKLPYWEIKLDGRHYRRGRLAWLITHGEWPNGDIDHIDCDSANDALVNLREATRSQNTMNKGRQSNNTSGYKGVFKTASGRFLASCAQKRLGVFDTAEEAHLAYVTYARGRYGEFARVE